MAPEIKSISAFFPAYNDGGTIAWRGNGTAAVNNNSRLVHNNPYATKALT